MHCTDFIFTLSQWPVLEAEGNSGELGIFEYGQTHGNVVGNRLMEKIEPVSGAGVEWGTCSERQRVAVFVQELDPFDAGFVAAHGQDNSIRWAA